MSESFVQQQLKILDKDEEASMKVMENIIYLQEDTLKEKHDIFCAKLELIKL